MKYSLITNKTCGEILIKKKLEIYDTGLATQIHDYNYLSNWQDNVSRMFFILKILISTDIKNILDYTAVVGSQVEKFILPGHLFSDFGLPNACAVWGVTVIPGCGMNFMILDHWLADTPNLSLYVLLQPLNFILRIVHIRPLYHQ